MAYTTTTTHGKVARVEKNDVAVNFTDGWNLDVNIDLADISRQGQNWKENLAGMAGWSGSFSGQLVLGNTEQKALHDNLVAASPGTKLTDMKFLINGSTEGWNGDVFVTGISIGATIGDKVSITVNFQGDGALTLSDAQ